MSETVPSAGMSGPYRHPVLKEGEAPAELVNRWTRTQLDKVVIPPFKSSRPLPFVKPAVLDGYFRAGVRGWKEFYRHYPKSVGLIKLSRPVYSADGRQALLFYRWQAAGTAGSSELVLLERTGTGWHPKRTLVLTKI